MRVKIVKTPKRKKSRKLSDELEYIHPSNRFEHFTKGPSLKFMDSGHLSNQPTTTTAATTTAESTTARATAESTTARVTTRATTRTTAESTSTTPSTAEISRRSGERL